MALIPSPAATTGASPAWFCKSRSGPTWPSARKSIIKPPSQPDFPNTGTEFNVGTVLDLSDQHHLLFSVGRSIDGPISFQCYLAYQFTFDNSLLHFWHHSPATTPP
jgi:hypothetical protein